MQSTPLGATFRNLSTLALAVAVVALPLHLVHATIFQNVIEVHELHDEIAEFPPSREVRGVSRGDVAMWRATYVMVVGAQLLAAALLVGAARRIFEVDEGGGVPTVPDAWRNRRPAKARGMRGGSRPLAVGMGMGALVWISTSAIVGVVVEMLPDEVEFLALALGQAAAWSLALPFPLAAIALDARSAPDPSPELY